MVNHAPLRFHRLTYLDQGDEVVVGRTDIDSYGAFPPDGAALLRRLEAGTDPRRAADWYRAEFGEEVDLDDFLDTLRALDFLREDDPPGEDRAEPAARPVPLQRLGRALFSRPAWLAYAALLTATALACADRPALLPRPGNLFFSPYALLVQLVVFVSQPVFMLLHEYGHVLAGRRLGLRTTLRISRRLYFVTFETALDGLVVLPRRSRLLPVLAGMLVDVLGAAALTLAAWASCGPDGTPSTAGRVCLALAFTAVPRLLAQFYFFLRTDLYHLAVVVLGGSDPHGTARAYVANRLNRLRGRTDLLTDESRWHPKDAAAARWYAPAYLLGYAAMTVMLATVVLPVGWRFTASALATVRDGSVPFTRLADAAFALAMVGVQLLAVAYGAWRAWRRRRTGAVGAHTTTSTSTTEPPESPEPLQPQEPHQGGVHVRPV
ncbi:hypothetical protein ACFY00_20185 [Kitasatospora sp. NPDC001540]|uniref:hypothetical protein n=1 Tax=Kitasatospora sp. NPDC001540 TaxID=3364014 RepID=UPI0036A85AEE